ncbi:fatty acid desaturase [Phormidium tenue FACHB-886]|nr:fatty acid desaturase [Phormidium tenue FACHB-886]
MDVMSQVFKYTQIFGNRENKQASVEIEATGIAAELHPSNSQMQVELSTTAPPRNQSGQQPAPPVNQNGNQPPPPPPAEGEEPPPPPLDGTPLPNVWIYAGEAYDLTEFIKKHPGGEFFIGRTKNRDITTIVNIFHRNPERVKKVLKKYALGRIAKPEDVHPKCNAPAFLFCDSFNSWRDTPKYSFDNKDQLLNRIRTRLNEPDMRKKVAQMDSLFDVITVLLVIAYVLVQVLRLNFTQYMPLPFFVLLMATLRISLAGVGHYLIHRPQVRLNKIFTNVFDINYVPMALVVADGHSLLHHPFTQSEVDIKKNVFTAMLELPRYYRIPVHTIHKIGHVFTGMFARTIEVCVLAVKCGVEDMYGSWQRGFPHFIGTFGMRVLLAGELVLFWTQGDLMAWFAQFMVTLWISTFMIVASHDFEEAESEAERDESQDWAVLQIKNSYDLTMVGNKYIDCFLSAGLSPHRVHHALPYQKSGFANIISETIVREEAEKFNIVWLEPKNFFLDRLPILVQHYLFSPSRMAQDNSFGLLKEHFHPKALMTTVDYILKGFAGIGSI